MPDIPDIGVNDFRQAARVGESVTLNQEESGLVRHGGFWTAVQKVVSWFKGIFKPGTVNADNKRVMQSFIRALKAEYGEGIGNMEATLGLQSDMEAGKLLTARKIRTVLAEADADRTRSATFNRGVADRFARVDVHGMPNCFGSLFADISDELGFRVPLNEVRKPQLGMCQRSIERKIMDAGTVEGRPNSRLVTQKEARAIAEKEIKEFICIELNHTMGIRFSEPKGTGDPCFSTVFSYISDEMGFGIQVGDLNIKKLSFIIDLRISNAGKANGDLKIVPADEAKKIAEQEIRKFIARKKGSLAKLDSLGVTPDSVKGMMKKIVLENDVNELYMEELWKARGSSNNLLSALSMPGATRKGVLKDLSQFYTAYLGHLEALNDPGIGGDDKAAFVGFAFQLGIATSGMDQGRRQKLYDFLNSSGVKELQDAGLFAQNNLRSNSQQAKASRMMDMLSSLKREIGVYLGKGREEIDADLKIPYNIKSLSDMPDELREALSDVGLDAWARKKRPV